MPMRQKGNYAVKVVIEASDETVKSGWIFQGIGISEQAEWE